MMLLGPKVGNLRKLVAICEVYEYAEKHGLKYNTKKSKILIFKDQNRPSAAALPVSSTVVIAESHTV